MPSDHSNRGNPSRDDEKQNDRTPNQKADDPKNSNQKSTKSQAQEAVKTSSQDPAVERGERIQVGKEIARGGKEAGKVPGAESSDKK